MLSIIEQEYQQFNKYIEFVPFYTNVENEGIELYVIIAYFNQHYVVSGKIETEHSKYNECTKNKK